MLRDSCFSIMADESTDRGSVKNLMVIARVADEEKETTVDLSLALLKVSTNSHFQN